MVAICGSVVCLKLSGRATFATSVDFKAAVERLRKRGHSSFVLDLSECVAMDSTFLGILVAQVQMLADQPEPKGSMHLLNPNHRITDFLENLEAMHLFKVIECEGGLSGRYEEAPTTQVSKKEMSRLCLDAHVALMNLNPANVPKFKEVARFLAEDLKQAEGQ